MTGIEIPLSDELVDAIATRVLARLDQGGSHDDEDPWMGVPASAAYLDCGKRRIYDLVAQGRLPRQKEGDRLVFRRSQLDALVAEEPLT
ncbi:MAG: helix-turn-helix domain-containing protein [Thermoleophilaceae bacterium]|nr:helix-turn-helix domain-containing protein [Thermoleophilaceae bacterium]